MHLKATTSKSAHLSTSPTPLVDTHKSGSERHNAQSLSVSPTLWWWTVATTERSLWLSELLHTLSRSYVQAVPRIGGQCTDIMLRSTSWPTKTPSKSPLMPSSTAVLAKTPPVLVQQVPSVVKLLMFLPSAASTKLLLSLPSVPVKPLSETSSQLLSAWLKSWSTLPREAATRTPSRRRMSWSVLPSPIGKGSLQFAWYMGFAFMGWAITWSHLCHIDGSWMLGALETNCSVYICSGTLLRMHTSASWNLGLWLVPIGELRVQSETLSRSLRKDSAWWILRSTLSRGREGDTFKALRRRASSDYSHA